MTLAIILLVILIVMTGGGYAGRGTWGLWPSCFVGVLAFLLLLHLLGLIHLPGLR